MSARTLRVSPADVSLFHVAHRVYGRAAAWLLIARANGLTDFLIPAPMALVIPEYAEGETDGVARLD